MEAMTPALPILPEPLSVLLGWITTPPSWKGEVAVSCFAMTVSAKPLVASSISDATSDMGVFARIPNSSEGTCQTRVQG